MTDEQAIDYAQKLLAKYNLVGWSASLDLSNKHFGQCVYGIKTIFISVYHIKINDDYNVKRTIIHEVAHAITKCGHSPIWKMKFQSMLNIELDSNEIVTTRFGKGRLPSAAEKKQWNNFDLKL